MEQEQTGRSKLSPSNWSLTGGSGFKALGNVFASPRNPRPAVGREQMLGAVTQQSRPCSVVLLRARCHRGPPALHPSRALLMSHCPWGPPICPLLTPTQCKATAGAVKTGHGAPGRGCRVQNPQAESRRVPQKGASRAPALLLAAQL